MWCCSAHPQSGAWRPWSFLYSTASHQQAGAEAPARKGSRRGKKRSKTSHSPGSVSCRQMNHQVSPGQDQDPEGGVGGFAPGFGPEAYRGFRSNDSLSSEGGRSHRSHSGTHQRAWKSLWDSCRA
eukprot:1206029-Pleurochrysis_carterae.AAC.1